MSQSAPALDRRTAADVLAQARELARAVYLKGVWRGVDDPADPAAQLLALFARMMEMLIGRLNRVPEKQFLAFLDLVGVEPSPGAAAAVPITFLPSAKALDGGLVPRGTQVATTQTEKSDAQVFETRATFYATAAKLVAGVNVVPAGAGGIPPVDRYSRVAPPALPPKAAPDASTETVVLAGGAAGLEELPHVLYLASATLFGRKEHLDVVLVFTVGAGDPSLLSAANLSWKRFDKAQKSWVPATATYGAPPGGSRQVRVVLPDFGDNEKTKVGGIADFWVACHFKTRLPGGGEALRLASIEGALSAPGTAGAVTEPPQKAFANELPLDLSRPFRPFGDRPRYGDAFTLVSSRAFAPEVDTVAVKYKLKRYSPEALKALFRGIAGTTKLEVKTEVAWEYLAADGSWKPLAGFKHTLTATAGPSPDAPIVAETGDAAAKDGTFFGSDAAPEATVTFTVPPDMGEQKVQGESGRRIRAILKSDDPYGREAFIDSPSPLRILGPTLMPPVVEGVKLSFTYRSDLSNVPLTLVTENNLRRTVSASGPAPSAPLTPFVPAADALPGGPALYLGFDRAFGDRYISLYVKLRETFPSVESPAEKGNPVLAWEYLARDAGWKPLDVDDATGRLSGSGIVGFLGPSDAAASQLFDADPGPAGQKLFWLRVRLASGSYDHPPAVQGLFLNTVLADNRFTFRKEVVLGSGAGGRGQRLVLPKAPVLGGELWVHEPEAPPASETGALEEEHRRDARLAGEDEEKVAPAVESAAPATGAAPAGAPATAVSTSAEAWVRWRRVPNFLGSGPRSRHYTLNPLSGEIAFGNGTQGLLPPILTNNLVFRDLKTGGGEAATRAALPLAVKELKSSLPYVDKVFNIEPAAGGSDPWSLDDVFVFGPQSIKNKGRAVSAEDFEWMVLQRFTQVARARCVSTSAPGTTTEGKPGLVDTPGAVTVLIVAKGRERIPHASSTLLQQIREYLGGQCVGVVASDIHVLNPGFTEVTVKARIRAVDPRESSEVERRAAQALEDFFHPLYGGDQGRGWDFGRDVPRSEVFAVLQRVPGVDYVESVELAGATAAGDVFTVGENALVNSGTHEIEMI